jgi:hypothetical protein
VCIAQAVRTFLFAQATAARHNQPSWVRMYVISATGTWPGTVVVCCCSLPAAAQRADTVPPHDTGYPLLTDGYADVFVIPADLAGTLNAATQRGGMGGIFAPEVVAC